MTLQYSTFENKSVRVLGPHIWNMLTGELKREISSKYLKHELITDLDLNVTAGLASM